MGSNIGNRLAMLAFAVLAGASPLWAGWSTQVTGTPENLKSVDFPSASIGYAAGQTGANWIAQTSETIQLALEGTFERVVSEG